MRINIVINDDTIRENISKALEDAEELDEIYFDFEQERTEFIDECVDEVISKYELYDYYSPNYDDIVRDMYELN